VKDLEIELEKTKKDIEDYFNEDFRKKEEMVKTKAALEAQIEDLTEQCRDKALLQTKFELSQSALTDLKSQTERFEKENASKDDIKKKKTSNRT